eukprot:TRINITY_DN30259_c0_g1_i1.p1 TRINITY_DN30259_c0_g1~~TRINITY_DN30259_c0_g1_i1.p1  ORF type:complete len:264 (+),score=49.91 TRINITY_DN30259_c0_g1_i1:71-862(+)
MQQRQEFDTVLDDDSDEEEVVEMNFKFYVKRLFTCMCWLGVLFGLGFLAMKLRGGEAPVVECSDNMHVAFTACTVKAVHTDSTFLPALALACGPDRSDVTTITFEHPPETWADQNSAARERDYDRCEAGHFKAHAPHAYSIECSALQSRTVIWGHRMNMTALRPLTTALHCLMQVNASGSTLPLNISTTHEGRREPPSCSTPSFTPASGGPGFGSCIGPDVSIVASVPFHSTLDVAHGNATYVDLPLEPLGKYNATSEFILLF